MRVEAPSAVSSRYRPDIDGLRAAAVLCVVAFHAFPALLPSGFIGVDVFFVISGYLISGIVYRDLAAGRFTFANFYARRAKRILPALAVALAACWALGCLFLLGDDLRNLGRHIAYGAAFASNHLLWKESGYFDGVSDLKPLLHLWSLAIEEQFYLTWPPLLVLAWKRRWSVPRLVGALLLASFAWNIWKSGIYGGEAFFLLPSRVWELMAGCGLAYYERNARAPRLPADLASAGAAALLAAGLLTIRGSDGYPGWQALWPVAATVLFLHAGPAGWVNRRVLARPEAVLIGRISYPLYLWHWIFLSYARIVRLGTPSPALICALVSLSFACAWVTWRFIELPLQAKTYELRPGNAMERRVLRTGLAALTALWALGFVTKQCRGLVWRYPAFEKAHQDFAWDLKRWTDCSARFGLPKDDYCWQTADKPRAVVWGDSHANQLISGLADGDGHEAISVVQVGKGNCPPLDGVELHEGGLPYGCLPSYRRSRGLVDREFASARFAVLSMHIPAALDPAMSGRSIFVSERSAESAATAGELFERGLSRTVGHLESLRMRVVFVLDVPVLGFHPEECVGARPFYPKERLRTSCFVARRTVELKQREFRRIVERVRRAHPRMAVFDPVPFFCDDRSCDAMLDGKLLYRDGSGHLTHFGSRHLGKPLSAMIEGLEGT